MIKKVFSLACFAILLVLGYFVSKFFVFEDEIATFNPSQCDLNLQNCFFSFNERQILISIEPKPLKAMQNLKIKIENFSHYEDLELRIYGLNMFMGVIKPKLIRTLNGYEADLLLSSCILDTMHYRAEFLYNKKTLGFYFDFEIKQ